MAATSIFTTSKSGYNTVSNSSYGGNGETEIKIGPGVAGTSSYKAIASFNLSSFTDRDKITKIELRLHCSSTEIKQTINILLSTSSSYSGSWSGERNSATAIVSETTGYKESESSRGVFWDITSLKNHLFSGTFYLKLWGTGTGSATTYRGSSDTNYSPRIIITYDDTPTPPPADKTITINGDTHSVSYGKTLKLTAVASEGTVDWWIETPENSISNPGNYATIDRTTGVLTPIRLTPPNTPLIISAYISGTTVKDTCTVSIVSGINSISLDPTEQDVIAGQSFSFQLTIDPSDAPIACSPIAYVHKTSDNSLMEQLTGQYNESTKTCSFNGYDSSNLDYIIYALPNLTLKNYPTEDNLTFDEQYFLVSKIYPQAQGVDMTSAANVFFYFYDNEKGKFLIKIPEFKEVSS